MKRKILIFTPNPGFGELIRQVVEENGDYVATLAVDGKQAMQALRNADADLMILDGELGKETLERVLEIQTETPNELKSLLVPLEDRDSNKELEGLGFDLKLKNPFYLPDLIEALQHFFGVSEAVRKIVQDKGFSPPETSFIKREIGQAPAWLKDSQAAAQYLMRLSLESSAQAALITYKDQVWAYSGELNQGSVDEISREIYLHWDFERRSDLARFVHLEANQADYMLYATSLGGDYALSLIFDTEIPFSKMRDQAEFLAQSLAKEPAIEIASFAENGAANSIDGQSSIFMDKENGSELNHFLADEDSALPEKPVQSKKPVENQKKIDGDRLVFSFLLIPRMPNHELGPELQKQLSIWVPQMCVAFGWRLDDYQIRRGYLLWTVEISRQVPPQSVAQIMAEQLSSRVFGEISRYALENPSGEFWATEALIVNGSALNQIQIDQYIRETRASQGLNT